MKGEWTGIPGEWIDDPTAIDGKRFVASDRGVRLLRIRMALDAHERCELCPSIGTDRHHVYGRGAGGSKTEDRPRINGITFVKWICRKCHDIQVIRPWGSWREEISGSAPPSESSRQSLGLARVPQCS